MKRSFQHAIRRSNKSPEGQPVVAFGLHVGYWPCIKGLFVRIAFAVWQVEIWYGFPSYISKNLKDGK